jgi:hypothetical protein
MRARNPHGRRLASWGLSLVWLLVAVPLGPLDASATNLAGQVLYVCNDPLCGDPDPASGFPPPVPPGAVNSGGQQITLTASGGGTAGEVVSSGRVAGAAVETAPPASLAPPRLEVRASWPTSNSGLAAATAFWEDDIIIQVPGAADGTIFFYRPMMSFTGNLDLFVDGAGGRSQWSGALSIDSITVMTPGGSCTGSSPGAADCSAGNAAFGVYTPEDFGPAVQIQSGVEFTQRGAVAAVFAGAGIQGGADLSSSVEWLGFELLDGSLQPVGEFTLTSASGIDWRLVSIPEPASAALLGLGLTLLAAASRRPRERRPPR